MVMKEILQLGPFSMVETEKQNRRNSMDKRFQLKISRCLLALALVVMLPTTAALAQEADYTPNQLNKALRETKREYKEYKSLK